MSAVTSRYPDMVHMYFHTVSKSKPNITVHDVSKYRANHIRFKLVEVLQTKAKQFILHILSIADSQTHQISTWHLIQ